MLIDSLILSVVGGILGYLIGGAALSTGDVEALMPVYLVISVLGLAYQLGFEASGGTPGKKILGMKIVDENGNPPGFGKALIRNLLRIVDALPFAYLLGIILMASSDQKQRLGDRAAGTYVVAK